MILNIETKREIRPRRDVSEIKYFKLHLSRRECLKKNILRFLLIKVVFSLKMSQLLEAIEFLPGPKGLKSCFKNVSTQTI